MLGAIAGDIIGSFYEHRNIKKTQFPLFHPLCRFTDLSNTDLSDLSSVHLRLPGRTQAAASQRNDFPNAE